VLRRVGKTAYRRSLVCILACAAGCVADTEPGRNRDRGHVITIVAPPAGSNDPPVISGSSSSSGGSEAGSGATPPPAGSGSGAGGVAGASDPGSGGGTAGSSPPVVTVPIDERTFDAGSDPARNMVQAGAVCTRLAQIQCAGEAYCCENPGRTVEQCETAMRAGCTNDVFLDAVTANPITDFDPAKAAAAFTQLEALASQCDPMIAEFGASATGLMSMLPGTIDSGRSCSPTGLDKASAAASLAACSDPTTTACLPTSTLIWTCRPRGAAGSQCFSDLNCQEGLHCPNPALAAGEFGTADCAPRKAEGSPCTLPNECTSFACKGGVCEAPSASAAYCLTK
jgi:hypothetical protein